MHELTYSVAQWLLHYGSFALFVLLALGIIGLPIPDETLLAFAGVLVAQGKLSLLPTLIAAFAGSASGISLSYVIGRTAGYSLIKNYGGKIGITSKRIKQVHNWFEHIGKWALFVGYFFMGVRHVTGYVAGASRLHYGLFAIFAYCGAILWVTTFMTLGYFFGAQLPYIMDKINYILIIVLGIAIILFLIWMTNKFFKNKKK